MQLAGGFERLRAAARRFREEPDLGLGITLAVVFAVLHLLDVVGSRVVDAATLALLGLLAFSLVIERQERNQVMQAVQGVRTELERTVSSVSATVEEAVSALASDYQYHTRWLELRYDLGHDGRLATATKRREIRFTRNDVLSIYEIFTSDGKGSKPRIEGGAPGEYRIPLPGVRLLRDDRGRLMQLVSLEKPRKRGEVMEIVSERTLTNCFRGSREYVNFEVAGGIDELILHVTWPRENPPRALELSRQGGRTPKRIAAIPLGRLEVTEDDRAVLIERVADPELGETITLLWDWDVASEPDPDETD